MTALGDLSDVDLSTVELADGTPLLVAWSDDGAGGGLWVGKEALPASAVAVDVDPNRCRVDPRGLYPTRMTLQDLLTSWQRDGFNMARVITDDDPGGPAQARSLLLTDYRRLLGTEDVGSNGTVAGLSYGRPGQPAGGFANATVILAEVLGSEDPANEVGGCIASLQMGRGDGPPPTGTLWGASYTLRGPVGRQPGALMAYTAVVQNYFDGSGSRSPNYGYAAVTRPGIGDGADFHVHDPIREATTYPIDFGFIVCGDSGPCPTGGEVGYRVAYQAGGAASPWAGPDLDWRTRIGTGLVVRDWLEGGVHVHPPHPDAGAAPQVRLDRRDGQAGNLIECRSEDGTVLAAVRPDGRVAGAPGHAPDDLVTRAQLDEAEARIAALEARLDALAPPVGPRLRDRPVSDLARRATPWDRRFWQAVGRRLPGRRTG